MDIAIRPDGGRHYPPGADAIGQILYSADGHVAAQLVRNERQRFLSDDWRAASDGEGAQAFKEYFGYLGTFSIDLDRRADLRQAAAAWFPNVEGDRLRRFSFENGHLVLNAETTWGTVRIVWARADGATGDEPTAPHAPRWAA
jgi:hypothetical protein